MRVGILNGGGDCPGLNAVIRGVVRKGTMYYGDSVVGFLEGWRGAAENQAMELDLDRVLATRYGVEAIDTAHRGEFGFMAALRGQNLVAVPLKEALSRNRRVDDALYEMASVFFG